MAKATSRLSLVAQFDDLSRNGRVLSQGIETGMLGYFYWCECKMVLSRDASFIRLLTLINLYFLKKNIGKKINNVICLTFFLSYPLTKPCPSH